MSHCLASATLASYEGDVRWLHDRYRSENPCLALCKTVFLIDEEFHRSLTSINRVWFPCQHLLPLKRGLQYLSDDVLLSLEELIRQISIQEGNVQCIEGSDWLLDVSQEVDIEVEYAAGHHLLADQRLDAD